MTASGWLTSWLQSCPIDASNVAGNILFSVLLAAGGCYIYAIIAKPDRS